MRKLIFKLKLRFKASIDWCIKKMESFSFRLSKKESKESHYTSLSPTHDADDDNEYYNAILWALENRNVEGIKNIALTGPIGSGKSSILKTFQRRYKGNEFTFLNISLATFKEELDEGELREKKKSKGKERVELLRLIETSILQQIFYQENDRKIPDSNFKKIKHHSRSRRIIITVFIFLYSAAITNLLNGEILFELFKFIEPTEKHKVIAHYSGLITFICCTVYILYKSIRLISSLALSKLKIQDLEIGLKMSVQKSVLNQHIDEIIYFFKVRPYNVVIIEDLDRFNETEIFTKLRELNLLLNNSQKYKKSEIVFIYAVRDDMFTDSDRTKFFDFIIPVIPVINSVNSKEIFLTKNKTLKSKLSTDFLEEVAYYIDDMRLLHNIMNEFIMYRSKLNKGLDENKLFAIIIYKNLYPRDFVSLNKNGGTLFGYFQSKDEIIQKKNTQLDEKVDDLKNELNVLKLILQTDIHELRMLYVLKAIEFCDQNFSSFQKKGITLSITQLLEDGNFKQFQLDQIEYGYLADRSNRILKDKLESFAVIEEAVDAKKKFAQRASEIEKIRNNRIRELQDTITNCEQQKKGLRGKPLTELIKNEGYLIDNASDLTKLLLQKGFIAEDYPDYITLFYEQSISRSDFQFILSVRRDENLGLDYPLTNADKVIQSLSDWCFKRHAVLNIFLVSELLNDPSKYQQVTSSVFETLSDSRERSHEFILAYIFSGYPLASFYRNLAPVLGTVLDAFQKDNTIVEENFRAIIADVLSYSSLESISSISESFDLRKYLLADRDFLSMLTDYDKTIEIIKELDLFISDIDFVTAPQKLLKFIYENHYYYFSPMMVENMISTFGVFDDKHFFTENFKCISGSKALALINYIELELESYLDEVYIKIETNVKEEEVYYLQLLNAKNVRHLYKEKLIQHVDTKLRLSSEINQFSVLKELITRNKLCSTWKNLILAFTGNIENQKGEKMFAIPDFIADFLSVEENSEQLQEDTFPKEMKNAKLFWDHLLFASNIENSAFKLLTKKGPWKVQNFDFEKVDRMRSSILIDNGCIQPSPTVFMGLKEQHENLHIEHIEKNIKEYLTIIEDLPIDRQDAILILESQRISVEHTSTFLTLLPKEVKFSSEIIKKIVKILDPKTPLNLETEMIEGVLMEGSISKKKRLELFCKYIDHLEFDFISLFFAGLERPYNILPNKSKRPLIDKSRLDNELLIKLKEKGFISNFSEENGKYRVYHKRT